MLFIVQAFFMKLTNDSVRADSILAYMTLGALLLAPVALWMTDFSQPINTGPSGPWLAAGIQVLNKIQLQNAKSLLVAADVNAVPPAGIEGLGVMDDGKPLESGSGKAVGIGALAIGNVKYLCQRGLFQHVAQLADVARPVVGLEHRHGVLGDAPPGQARRGRDLVHEEGDQLRHVLAPFG